MGGRPLVGRQNSAQALQVGRRLLLLQPHAFYLRAERFDGLQQGHTGDMHQLNREG